jgi:hypothetical protein
MPVSKKRKKEGKPVHRSQPPPAEAGPEGQAPAPEAKVDRPLRVGRPSNPFVAMQQLKRGAQRGR